MFNTCIFSHFLFVFLDRFPFSLENNVLEGFMENVGTIDRLIRLGTALLILLILVKSGKVSFVSALLLVASGMLFSSASSGTCALYTQLGLSTAENGSGH
jgi:hypothetical protein